MTQFPAGQEGLATRKDPEADGSQAKEGAKPGDEHVGRPLITERVRLRQAAYGTQGIS
jgi:hypothetical protein